MIAKYLDNERVLCNAKYLDNERVLCNAKYLDNERVLCYGVVTDVTSHHAIFWQCKKYSYLPISKFIKIWRGCQKISKSKSGHDNAPEQSHRQSMPKIIKFFFVWYQNLTNVHQTHSKIVNLKVRVLICNVSDKKVSLMNNVNFE